jgi:pSer/pThr/pTyr-binding forkhead associated (FHA) protein
MAKLVILSQGFTGQTHELKVDKTTIGRVEDNTFPIAEPSVSSHHCEILLRGPDVVVKDLNSTNGTFINGDKVTGEAVLKPGQILRLGQVELRLETGAPGAPAAPGTPARKSADSTLVVPRGGAPTALETGARGGFDNASAGFSKKGGKGNRVFLIVAIIVGVLIVALLLVAFLSTTKPASP